MEDFWKSRTEPHSCKSTTRGIYLQLWIKKTQRKPKGQSGIDYQEILATLDTHDTGRRQTKQKHIQRNKNKTHHSTNKFKKNEQYGSKSRCSRRVTGSVSYKTPVMFLLLSISVGHHYAQSNTNNINKTWALLQTTCVKTNRTSFLCGNRSG